MASPEVSLRFSEPLRRRSVSSFVIQDQEDKITELKGELTPVSASKLATDWNFHQLNFWAAESEIFKNSVGLITLYDVYSCMVINFATAVRDARNGDYKEVKERIEDKIDQLLEISRNESDEKLATGFITIYQALPPRGFPYQLPTVPWKNPGIISAYKEAKL